MASTATATSQNVTLPFVPELHDPAFLDVLLPVKEAPSPVSPMSDVPLATHPMIDALKATALQTLTENGSPAFNSTGNAILDAFTTLKPYCSSTDVTDNLAKSWKEDPNLTLRIIWNTRSIHDGKSDKELFYQAFGWLYHNHPRTAIENIPRLVEPLCSLKKGQDVLAPHGYWKDLLNIVALAAVDQLRPLDTPSTFLHCPRTPPRESRAHSSSRYRRPNARRGGHRGGAGRTARPAGAGAAAAAEREATERVESRRKRVAANEDFHATLLAKLEEPRFRALYIMVTRLFAERLVKDIAILDQLEHAPESQHVELSKQISLAGKWAPTPGGSHDRRTNLATAIATLVFQQYAYEALPALQASPNTHALPAPDAHTVRSFYQRWILTPLRRVVKCPEPLMSANRWKEINYARVASICMKTNMKHFFSHDPDGFEKYLEAVENGKRKISGATLLPHELLSEAVKLYNDAEWEPVPGKPNLKDVHARLAKAQLRAIELQWKAMVDRLRDAGSLDNAIAICDVSGSMGFIEESFNKRNPSPIWPALALSLVLAQLAKPPFANCFITFSATPQFVQLDPSKSLNELVQGMVTSSWSMNTDLNAVFLNLLLPLAIKNNVKQEDMIKRLFIFSDMQFDDSTRDVYASVNDPQAVEAPAAEWETNHDVIEKAFKAAGYELPEIVYWNLAAGTTTTPVLHDRKGVALMSGYSPSMMKVFLGEADEVAEEGWEAVNASDVEPAKAKEEFNPVNVMKKALLKKSYDGLVVVD